MKSPVSTKKRAIFVYYVILQQAFVKLQRYIVKLQHQKFCGLFLCPYLCAKFCRGTKYSKILELYCDYMRLEFYYIYLSIITSLRIQEKELPHKFKQ